MPDSKKKPTPSNEPEIAHLASFPELNPNPVMEIDLTGRIHYLNPASRKAFPGLESAGQGHPYLAGLASVGKSLRRAKKDYTVRSVAVGERYYEQDIYLVPGTTRLLIYGRDVTERKQAEEQLRLGKLKMEHLFSSSIIGTLVADLDGNILEANDAFLEMVGYTREDLRARRLDWRKMTPPEYQAQYLQGLKEIFDQGFCQPYEQEYIRRDGTPVPVLIGASLWDTSGPSPTWVGFVIDITIQKKAEKARKRLLGQVEKEKDKAKELAHILKKERDVLDTMMENTGAMLVFLDPEFHFVRVNSAYANACGYTRSQLIGRNHFDLFPDEENEAIFKKVRDTGVPVAYHDKPFVYASQPERGVTYWDWTLVPVKDNSGPVLGLVFSLVETTERVRAEERLRLVERLEAIGELAGNISHELRNPLSTIGGSAFFLERYLADAAPKVKEHLKRIQSGVEQSTGILQSLLEMTQLTEPKRESMGLKSLLNNLVYETEIPPAVQVVLELPAEEVSIEADWQQLSLAFRNIMDNAVEAMVGRGTLQVSLCRRGDEVEVAISDTGPGIPPELQNKIFEPLFSTKPRGTGLGLSMSRMAIERNGGTIRVQSPPGKGATFIATFPISAPPPPPPPKIRDTTVPLG